MERREFAFWSVLTGLFIGVLGNIFFYGQFIGLSFPLFTLAVIGALVLSSVRTGTRLFTRNLWILLPIVFFALMVAVHADPLITLLNIAAVLGLGGLALHYMTLEQPLDEETLTQYAGSAVQAGFGVFSTPGKEVSTAWAWVREQGWHENAPWMAVGRGLVITLPIVLVFAILLGAADAVFAQYFNQVWDAIAFRNLPNNIGRLIFILMLSWLATGAIAYSLMRYPGTRRYFVASDEAVELDADAEDGLPFDEPEPANKRKPPLIHMGIIETGILLGSLNLLFGAFVLIQFTYFFGGEANISIEGYTYSEYARRGFFELLAVSILTLGLVLFLDWMTIRPQQRDTRIFQGLALGIVIFMLVMIASASRRMLLYEEAYGFTHLRVYSHVFIVWLGVLFLAFTLALFRLKTNVFSLGVLLVSIGYLGTLNLMNVDYYIASQNINRYKNGEQLDICYLRNALSLDALPAMLELYEISEDSYEMNIHLTWWLSTNLTRLDNSRDMLTFFSANVSRDYAWWALDGMRDELPPPHTIDSAFWWCSWTTTRTYP